MVSGGRSSWGVCVEPSPRATRRVPPRPWWTTPGRTACSHWDRRAGADPAAAWRARQSRRGPEIAPQALRLLFITNGPTTPAHFVRVVEIFARELVLPRLNDALRVADQFCISRAISIS